MNAALSTLFGNTPAFNGVPRTAVAHFRLALLGAIAQLTEVCADGDRAALLGAHPCLGEYEAEIAARLQRADVSASRWRSALGQWEEALPPNLPLRALRRGGLAGLDIELLLAAGVAEEDSRFSDLFEQATGGVRRVTSGLLLAGWRTGEDGEDRAEEVRRAIFGLVRAGLLEALNPSAPRSEWILAVPAPVWDAMRGDAIALPWLEYHAPSGLLPMDRFITPAAMSEVCAELPRLLVAQPQQAVVVRGPRRNGRKTLLGAVACALGKGVLVADGAVLDDEPRARLFGVLAAMLDALPVVELALHAGENRTLPPWPLVAGPVAVVAGLNGGIQAGAGRALLSLTLPLPTEERRRLHWRAAAHDSAADLEELTRGMRLSSGNIRRAAVAAATHARLEGRGAITVDDVRLACRGLHGSGLETVAKRLDTAGLDELVLDAETRADLGLLESRCRFREALDGGAQGVRALLAGPSGTGKTLAARRLAAALGKDLYRVDLAATVSKYLGETEKGLEQAFSAAEELDVVLLLDEGDSLMASRTDVASSNDRYANLETNFLLQRMESFGGILLITSNAADRIDKAFARRMDVVIAFRTPDDLRRYQILRMHLGGSSVEDELLQEIACRCDLTGGQLRNVALHARLLALEGQRPLASEDLRVALQREYRKTGARSPLKSPDPAVA